MTAQTPEPVHQNGKITDAFAKRLLVIFLVMTFGLVVVAWRSEVVDSRLAEANARIAANQTEITGNEKEIQQQHRVIYATIRRHCLADNRERVRINHALVLLIKAELEDSDKDLRRVEAYRSAMLRISPCEKDEP